MSKRCIFSYLNKIVDNKIALFQQTVLEKLTKETDIQFRQFFYESDVTPDVVLDYGVRELLYKQDFKTILVLDIDCIPLSKQALEYTFNQAEKDILVGNIQRANHLENNQHLYVGPSAMCFTKALYEATEEPSFAFTHKGDVGEEITYKAEEHKKEIEYYIPSGYEKLPVDGIPWKLTDELPDFGIGTTYVNKHNQEMFYHLFQSIFNSHNQLFYDKCAEVLKN